MYSHKIFSKAVSFTSTYTCYLSIGIADRNITSVASANQSRLSTKPDIFHQIFIPSATTAKFSSHMYLSNIFIYNENYV